MRKDLAAVLMMLPATVLGQSTRLDNADPEPRIVATATRTARIAPDRVTLFLMIEGSGESAAEAAQRAAGKLQAVTSALQPFANTRDAISTMPYGVSPAPNINGYPGSSSQTSFVARYLVRIQPSRLDQITPITTAAIGAGASATGPPSFEATGADSVRRLRYAEALSQARRDAEAIAAALGGKLGAVLEVSSNGGPNQSGGSSYVTFMNRFELGGPMQPPEVLVSATVTVRYRFIP